MLASHGLVSHGRHPGRPRALRLIRVTAPNRVYLARLAGLAVFDPNGDLVGRVRDAVARTPRHQPTTGRWSGWWPSCRCAAGSSCPSTGSPRIDAESVVLGTGTLNLRRFEKRPGELLVLEDLLDRRVRIEPTGQPGIVVDVAMESNRDRRVVADPGRRTRTHRPAHPPGPTASGRVGQGAWADRATGDPGHGQPAGGAGEHAPGRPGERPAGAARRPAQRGGRRAGRRAPRRRAQRAARARPGGDSGRAGPGTGRRRAGGDGPGRRRRPTQRAAPAGSGGAARPDAAG